MKNLGTVLKAILIAFLIAALISGCAEAVREYDIESAEGHVYEIRHGRVERFMDHDYNVICYVYSHAHADEGGISCLPLNQTRTGQ